MFIKLDSHLSGIQARQKDNLPAEEIPIDGTIAVIDGTFNFQTIDGYIQFLELTMDNISRAYGEQDKGWQGCIDRIRTMARALQDHNVKFTGNSEKEFRIYCKKISAVFADNAPAHLNVPKLIIETSDDLISFIEKQIALGNNKGFYFDKKEDAREGLMYDLMDQLSHLKMDKQSREYDISYFLMGKYHEHVYDAFNTIKNTAVYAMNCASTREQGAYDFDTQKVLSQLQMAETIMARVVHLV